MKTFENIILSNTPAEVGPFLGDHGVIGITESYVAGSSLFSHLVIKSDSLLVVNSLSPHGDDRVWSFIIVFPL